MPGALDGLKILVPESRDLDLFVTMLEAEGATAVRCPLVRILDLEDTADAETWMAQLMRGDFQDAIWLTGEGLRRLLTIAQRHGRRVEFVDGLSRVRSITRGPKPARVLRELGLAPDLTAPSPTSQGVIDALVQEDIAGRKIGVQLYPGDGAKGLLAYLHERSAVVFPVTPYRYASQTDAAQVADAIRKLVTAEINAVAFTSSPQVERLVDVAREAGLSEQLRDAFARITVAAIGPIVEETLRRHGVAQILRPESAFHLKPLVRAIAAARMPRA